VPELLECNAVIAVVDDDPSVRRGLERLIRSMGWNAKSLVRARFRRHNPGSRIRKEAAVPIDDVSFRKACTRR
jgi:FixJ family two-component response regulator